MMKFGIIPAALIAAGLVLAPGGGAWATECYDALLVEDQAGGDGAILYPAGTIGTGCKPEAGAETFSASGGPVVPFSARGIRWFGLPTDAEVGAFTSAYVWVSDSDVVSVPLPTAVFAMPYDPMTEDPIAILETGDTIPAGLAWDAYAPDGAPWGFIPVRYEGRLAWMHAAGVHAEPAPGGTSEPTTPGENPAPGAEAPSASQGASPVAPLIGGALLLAALAGGAWWLVQRRRITGE